MPTENRLFGMPATFSIQSSRNFGKTNSPWEGAMMLKVLCQAVVEKTNIRANKCEKVRVEEKKQVRASASVPQHVQGWLWMYITSNNNNL